MKKIIKEFREFIKRGNVIDLAVAVVMGQSFSAIVNSLVNDIIMPLIGILIGGVNFSNIKITLGDATINCGNFIQSVVNFLIVAFSVFIAVKFMNRFISKIEELKKSDKEEKKEENKVPPKKSDEVLLLEEIRDSLKKEFKEKRSINQ